MPVMWRRALLFCASLIPVIFISFGAATNQLGADPAKAIVLFTGTWAFYFLLITLSVSPLKRLANQSWLMVHRRMLGLFTLFYAVLHMLAYLIFILGLNFSIFGAELVKRPYILLTIPAVILLIVLGITSTKGMMRRLGKNWVKLHKSIYLIAILAWLHVLLQVRSSYADAVLFGVLTAGLLGIRCYWFFKKKSSISSSKP
ncbi:protein-methionine-sulfoxide reductase heme-binding subunit MsrQ [Cellvibrio zantedeschiae]|uniref:Protein-methionine-sulfoxide reductase heme-binding subunit MsrQ n=1 Tax=Cellvibrio zantedeschiae TaxID=1237077 RepID=A0ABQ3AZK0_9GAMM|nr:protein-methionine-sulfoxide reductase heme-binding subunit MsrQ [Cellvibrio zantedeschiae]GGY70246.1 protein-methionine-sulfoxide reductase heme-binding subunit MsrQ [Cellvibrio zantedeschiae]